MNQAAERVPTGVPGLDTLLGGGLLPGALAVIAGAPGVGKTVLAQHMAFASAARGVPVTYFTTMSEPHDKLLRHVQGFRFFDPELIGNGVQLLSLEQLLRQGADETADAIVQTARAQRAGLVVIDAFRSAGDLLGGVTGLRARALLYQLSGKLGVIGACCLITFEADPWDPAIIPDLVPPDVVLALALPAPAWPAHRHLQVLKARGSNPLPGMHSLQITTDGVACYPQAEALPVRPPGGILPRRAAFGIAGLDALMQGGPTAGTSTLIAGAPGVGKTLLALAWLLAGAARGEPGLLIGFHESAQQLIDHADQLGLDLRGRVDDGSVALWTQQPVGLDGNVLAAELRARVAERGVRRLVVDSALDVERSVGPARAVEYLAALVAYLRGEGISTLLTYDVSSSAGTALDFAGTPTTVLAENLLLLQIAARGAQARALQVLKMRFSAYDPGPRAYEIAEGGLHIGGPVVVTGPGEAAMTSAPADAGDG